MGHFGAKPIRLAWCGLVLPALALNYLGQGALLMRDPGAIDNPSTASSRKLGAASDPAGHGGGRHRLTGRDLGAYSMTKQAIQLGFLPA